VSQGVRQQTLHTCQQRLYWLSALGNQELWSRQIQTPRLIESPFQLRQPATGTGQVPATGEPGRGWNRGWKRDSRLCSQIINCRLKIYLQFSRPHVVLSEWCFEIYCCICNKYCQLGSAGLCEWENENEMQSEREGNDDINKRVRVR